MKKENAEFIRLHDKSGWNQTVTAQRLGLSGGAISQYLSGETKPSETVLIAFRLLLGEVSATAAELAREDVTPYSTAHERDILRIAQEMGLLVQQLRDSVGVENPNSKSTESGTAGTADTFPDNLKAAARRVSAGVLSGHVVKTDPTDAPPASARKSRSAAASPDPGPNR